MKKNITAHVAVERFDRISYIIDTIGLGEEILFEALLPNSQNVTRRMALTNTGVILVKPLDADIVITAWIASIEQAVKISKASGHNKMPESIYRKIKNNKKYAKNQP